MPNKKTHTWERPVLSLALAMTALRIYLSASLGLGDDEAYYWEWSRHLDLSYYDHPAMTAWLIRLGTEMFGPNTLGVRSFGILSNVISGVMIWKLGERLFGRPAALLAVMAFLFAPIYCLGGLLMVPDAPMGACWLGATYLAWDLFERRDTPWKPWLLAGLVIGLGFLSKYTMILLAFSIVLYMLSDRSLRARLRAAPFWGAVGVAALCCVPILLWNERFDWPTVKFHLRDRQSGGGGANFTRWGQFWGSQAVLLGPALFLVCLGVWVRCVRMWNDRRWRFVFLMTFPTFAIFCAQALFAEFKPHWPAPAYPLMLIGAGEWMRDGFGLVSPRARVRAQWIVAVLVLAIFIPINLIFHVGVATPIVPKLFRAFSTAEWDPKFDPTNDLYGWDQAVGEAARLRAEAVAHGEAEPFLSSSRYQLVSQIAFASGEVAYRVSPGQDQYKFWQTPEVMAPLLGRPSVFIVDNRFERDPRNDNIFESCEVASRLRVRRGLELARRFELWYCKGFKGLQ